MKATKEWKEEVRSICCFNKMLETGLSIKNKSISYSSGEWEIQYASRFAVWPVLSHCSEAGILSAMCSCGRRGTRQTALLIPSSPFIRVLADHECRVLQLHPNSHTTSYRCCFGD